MTVSQTQLALLYLYAGLLGMGLGFFYDCFRLIRIFCGEHFSAVANRFEDVKLPLIEIGNERKKRKRLLSVIIFVEDFIFCIVAAICLILLFYQINNGKIRLMAFPLAGAGFFLYRITIGKFVMLCSETVAFVLEAAVRYICFFLLFPWKWLFNRVRLVLHRFWNKQTEKHAIRERMRYTKAQLQSLETDVDVELLGKKKEKGARQNVRKKQEAIQSDADGQNLSRGHRSCLTRRVRQQRHEVQ